MYDYNLYYNGEPADKDIEFTSVDEALYFADYFMNIWFLNDEGNPRNDIRLFSVVIHNDNGNEVFRCSGPEISRAWAVHTH